MTVSIFDNCSAGSSWFLCFPWYCFKQSLVRLVAALDAFEPKRRRMQKATVAKHCNSFRIYWPEAKKRGPPGASSTKRNNVINILKYITI